MPQIVCKINLDVAVSDSGLCLMAKSGDYGSRCLSVTLTDCDIPLHLEQDTTVLLNVRKNGESKSFAGEVVDGAAVFAMPAFLLETAGTAKCDVSLVDASGNRLTAAAFEIAVEESVCPDSGASQDHNPDVVAALLASEKLYDLKPVVLSDQIMLAPMANRKYRVDLSEESLAQDHQGKPIKLLLPTPENEDRECWVLLYCHAPVSETAGPVIIDWGSAHERLFADGAAPTINAGDFDVVCTYSHAGGKWQIGVVQYAQAEEQA